MLRSVLAVIAGIVVLTAASFAIEAALGPWLLRTFPHEARALTFSYGMLCVAAGGYVAALLARRLPIRHAGAMGLTQAGLTIVAMFSPDSNHASTAQWIAIATLSIPAALAGGFLRRSLASR